MRAVYSYDVDCPGNPDKVCLEIEKNGGQSFPLAASVEDTNAIMGAVKGKVSFDHLGCFILN